MYHHGGQLPPQQQQYRNYYGPRGAAADDDAPPGPCCYFHPREVVVGVCAACLRERLLVLAAKQSGSGGRSSRGSIGGGVSGSCHLRPFSRARRGVSGSSRGKVISMISIPKVFALGSFLGGGGGGSRTEARLGRKKATAAAAVDDPEEESISSLEDSFISIKFGTDGRASWDSKKTAAAAAAAANPAPKSKHIPSILLPPAAAGFQNQEQYPTTASAVVDDDQCSQRLSVVEHPKSRSSPLRWRKRIAHLLHLIRWRRSTSGKNGRPAGGAAAAGCKADAAVGAVAVVGKGPRRSGWMRSLTRRRSADHLA